MGRNEKIRAEKKKLRNSNKGFASNSRPYVKPNFRDIASNLEFQLEMRRKLLAEIHSRSDWHGLAISCVENHQAMMVEQLNSDKNGGLFTASNCSYDEIYSGLSDRDCLSVKAMASHSEVALLFVYQEFEFPVLCYGYTRDEVLGSVIAA